MPKIRGGNGHKRQAQFGLAQARKNPEQHTQTGGDAKAVKQQIVRGGLGAAVSQPRTIGKHVRLVEGHDGDE